MMLVRCSGSIDTRNSSFALILVHISFDLDKSRTENKKVSVNIELVALQRGVVTLLKT